MEIHTWPHDIGILIVCGLRYCQCRKAYTICRQRSGSDCVILDMLFPLNIVQQFNHHSNFNKIKKSTIFDYHGSNSIVYTQNGTRCSIDYSNLNKIKSDSEVGHLWFYGSYSIVYSKRNYGSIDYSNFNKIKSDSEVGHFWLSQTLLKGVLKLKIRKRRRFS